MKITTKLLFITAGFAALSGCGGGDSASPAPTVAPALAPIAAPGYVATDNSCVATLATAGTQATAGKIDDMAPYFGSYVVSLSSGGTTTFSLQHPGTATLKGVSLNIQSVCMVASNGVNWRRASFANGDSFNMDMQRTIGATAGVNGTDFSTATLPRGRFSNGPL